LTRNIAIKRYCHKKIKRKISSKHRQLCINVPQKYFKIT
jgi:hypothetical protein